MTSRSIFVALFLFAIACRREPAETAKPPATQTVTTTVTAPPTDLKAKDVITTIQLAKPPVSSCEVKPSFTANEPIDFTMALDSAPEKLHVSVRVFEGEEEIAFVRQPAEGKTSVTLRLPKLKAGKYKVEGLWGGNRACEKEIEVKE
jgi:hypothetical protein